MLLIIATGVPLLMFIGWLIHIAVCWHWDFKAWYHDSDDDFQLKENFNAPLKGGEPTVDGVGNEFPLT